MKKREFVKELKRDNKAILKFEIYSLIVALLLMGMYFVNKGMFDEQITSLTVFLIISLFIIVTAIVGVIFDIKHETYISRLFKEYQEKQEMPEYKDDVKPMKAIFIIMVAFIVFMGAFIFSDNFLDKSKVGKDDVLVFTTNKNNSIEMEYEDFGGILLKIPKDFEIMAAEYVEMKYPLEDRPSLVYTNEDGSINIGYSVKETLLGNDEVEETTKQVADIYDDIFESLDFDIIKKDNYNIGMLKFISPAVDSKIYNHLMIMSIDGKVVMVSFNCMEEDMDEWKAVGDFILKSVVFE